MPRNVLLLVGVAAVLVVLLALWIGSTALFVGRGAEPSLSSSIEHQTQAAGDPESAALLRELLDEVRAMRRDIAAQPRSSGERVPVQAVPGSSEGIVRAMERLTAALIAFESSSRSNPAAAPLTFPPSNAPGFPNLDALFADARARRNLSKDWEQPFLRECRRLHSLWSIQQLVERYGLPVEVKPLDMGPRLVYSRGSGGSGDWVHFQTNHGIVVDLLIALAR